MKGISYKQEQLMKSILADDSNRDKAGVSDQLFYAWRKRFEAGTLSDEKQYGILVSLGYVVDRERTWIKKV